MKPNHASDGIPGFDGLRATAAFTIGMSLADDTFLPWFERPLQRLFASRKSGQKGRRTPGRMAEIDAAVQSTLDPLNSPGVAVDHLA